MNLIKRLHNIWKLSEYIPTIDYPYIKHDVGDKFTTLVKPRMAEIIRKRDPIAEALKEEI